MCMIKKHLVNRKDIVIFQNPNLFDVLTASIHLTHVLVKWMGMKE